MEEVYSAWKVEQINDHLFIDNYKSTIIHIGVNDMTVNVNKMCVRWKDEARSIPEISFLSLMTKPRWIQTKAQRKSEIA